MLDLKMLNSTKYLYKLTFIKCSYERQIIFTKTKNRHKNSNILSGTKIYE